MSERELISSNELLPCPFCGAAGELGESKGAGHETYFTVLCAGDCECDAGYFVTEAAARAAWNKRSPHEPLPAATGGDDNARCSECGMKLHDASEYHPFAACLMFRASGDRQVVLANLSAVIERAAQPPNAFDKCGYCGSSEFECIHCAARRAAQPPPDVLVDLAKRVLPYMERVGWRIGHRLERDDLVEEIRRLAATKGCEHE